MKIESSRIPSQNYDSLVGVASGVAPTVSVLAISKAVKSISSSFPDSGLTHVIETGLKRLKSQPPRGPWGKVFGAVTYGMLLSLPGAATSLAASEMINARRAPPEWQAPKSESREWCHRTWDMDGNAARIGSVAPLLALAPPGGRIVTAAMGGPLILNMWP